MISSVLVLDLFYNLLFPIYSLALYLCYNFIYNTLL